jgi:hypothetical protein
MRLMSYCPKCGKSYENNKYKCSYCGAPLVYGPSSNEGPGIFEKILQYKSFIILVVLAIAISMVSVVAQILSTTFWIIAAAIAGVAAFTYFRQKNRQKNYGAQNRFGPQPPRNDSFRNQHSRHHIEHKHSNVIPLKRKRSDKDRKTK